MADFLSKEEKVHYVFSRIAKHYDLMNTVLSFRRHKAWRKFAMSRMNVKPGQSAIDVAAGTGDWTISLAQAVGPQGRIVGLDFCQEMLDCAIPKVAEAGVSKQVQLIQGNAMDLPFADNTFDYATIGFALRNVPDVKHVLQEMTRVVKPGGMVVSLELSKPTWPPFSKLYYLYFEKILPAIGSLASKDHVSYQWLPESLKDFPDAPTLAGMFEQAGLDHVKYWLLTGGIAAVHIGYKSKV
ncbi:demethylmenaquinone methyltransferase [Collibacillus ludicampi]|jgi:demethylmenaquinone methyltransferase/2-methoxy-6-polyprenyl-1,4-benzoquinol methylase|uniref:Demethylmenaquinone methyltransferase n=1 Tax=Collibacillus ludicampi TaxID=2771369 RepID=A0AAV4LKD7_9BACL|nr:demethylmenaquinone methyltransferase [Collibacillus ludicampi]GIM48196.1 demethylmenaquinone methyltransferase [Collibacillus ludicampi]